MPRSDAGLFLFRISSPTVDPIQWFDVLRASGLHRLIGSRHHPVARPWLLTTVPV